MNNLIFLDGKNPSPANYNVRPLIDGTGKIFVSSYRSGMAKSILTKLNGKQNRWNSKLTNLYLFCFVYNKEKILLII